MLQCHLPCQGAANSTCSSPGRSGRSLLHPIPKTIVGGQVVGHRAAWWLVYGQAYMPMKVLSGHRSCQVGMGDYHLVL